MISGNPSDFNTWPHQMLNVDLYPRLLFRFCTLPVFHFSPRSLLSKFLHLMASKGTRRIHQTHYEDYPSYSHSASYLTWNK